MSRAWRDWTKFKPDRLPGAVVILVAGGVMIDARRDGAAPSPQEMVDLVNDWRELGAFRYP